MIKKGANISTILISMVFIIWVTTVSWTFFTANADQAGFSTAYDNYSSDFNTIKSKQSNLEDFKDSLSTAGQSITEGSWLDAGYYGLIGVMALLKVPFDLISLGESMFAAFSPELATLLGSTTISIILLIITIIIIIAAVTLITNKGREI